MTEQVLTVADVAGLVRCSTKTVARAIDKGHLRASQLADRGVWRILPSDVDAWLELRANIPRDQPVTLIVPRPVDVKSARSGPARRRSQRQVIETGRLELPERNAA